MSAQFENQFSQYTQQFTSVAARANRIALENAESMFGVQLKTFEKNVHATTDFLGEVAEAHDMATYQALWPKGMQIARENLERIASANQELVGVGMKASEALGQLARGQFESMTEQVQETVAKATKAARGGK